MCPQHQAPTPAHVPVQPGVGARGARPHAPAPAPPLRPQPRHRPPQSGDATVAAAHVSVSAAGPLTAHPVGTRDARLTRPPVTLDMPSPRRCCPLWVAPLTLRLVDRCTAVRGSTRSRARLVPRGGPVPAERRRGGEVQLGQEEERGRQVGGDPWVEPVLEVRLQPQQLEGGGGVEAAGAATQRRDELGGGLQQAGRGWEGELGESGEAGTLEGGRLLVGDWGGSLGREGPSSEGGVVWWGRVSGSVLAGLWEEGGRCGCGWGHRGYSMRETLPDGL